MGLVIEHVTKCFGKMTAVNDISLEASFIVKT